MRELIMLLICITVLIGCTTSTLPYQEVTIPPDVEKVDICDESATNEANDTSKPDPYEANLENGLGDDEEGSIVSYIPYTQTPQRPPDLARPPDIDWDHQATLVSPGAFASKLESLLSSNEYGGIFFSLRSDIVIVNIWTVDSVAVDSAIQAAHEYFEGREFVHFELYAHEARASREELETLRTQIREIELEGERHQFLTPLIVQEQNGLLIHGAVLDESRIRSEINLLLRANDFTEEIVEFDLHCALEDIITVPPAARSLIQ